MQSVCKSSRAHATIVLAFLVIGLITASPVTAVTLDYAFIVDMNTPIPGGTGNFTLFPRPGISNGDVIFKGDGTGGQTGIYFYRGGVLDVLVNQDTLIPDGTGTFTAFQPATSDPQFNVAFRAEGASSQLGIYTSIGGTLSALADSTTDVPGTGGAEQFTNFSVPWIYDGEVAFRGMGSGGTDGIYTNAGGSLRVVADTNTNIPDGTGTFSGFGFDLGVPGGFPGAAPDIDGGDIVFRGDGSSGQEGIYAEINGTLIKVADKNTLIPGTANLFPGFNSNIALAANISDGEIAFVAGADSSNQIGLYKYSLGTLSTIVDTNTVNPKTGGTLTRFGGSQGYGFDKGDVSFLGQDNTSAFNTVFAVLGGQVTSVATPGDAIEGVTILNSLGTYGLGLEDGNVAFNTFFNNIVAIQEHRWVGSGSNIYQGTGSGDLWDDPANWPFGLLPRDVVPTVIDPGGDVTVHGPHSDATLTSLQVGGATGIATLWLHGGALVTVPSVNVTSTGVLAGNGPIVGNILNNGLIRPENISAKIIQNNAVIDLATIDARLLSSNRVTNDGTITGDGTLLAVELTNNGLVDVGRITINGGCIENFGELRLSRTDAIVDGSDEIHNMGLMRGSGTIAAGVFENHAGAEIRVGNGERLEFQTNDWSSQGLLEVIGGDFESNFQVGNFGSGLIAGREATFRFGPGLTNSAAFAITFGTSDVFGDVTNNAAGSIVLTGNSNTTFYDDVTNNGVFQVSSGSTVVFLGDFVGANGVSGPGAVFMEGDLRPGNSPATVSFGGDLHFGALASLEIELGGTLAGIEFDQIAVGDTAELGGTLNILLINGFTPTAGDTFEIITAASILGTFAAETLPALPGGLEWFVNYRGTSVELISAFPGDFDFDGEVDGADFLAWQRGESPNPLSASNLADWEANYGNVAPLAATSTAVPEPSGIALLVAGLVCVTPRRRNGRAADDQCARPISSRL